MTQKSYLDNDTITAIATPSGLGAIGVIRLSGPEAVKCAAGFVSIHKGALDLLAPQKSALGMFHQNGRRIDQVVVTVFRAPHSYTGEDIVEISCHGSPVILKEILNLLVSSGARLADPGEFSQRAFLNGKMDLSQAESVADLIRSQTELSRSVAFSQFEGGLSQEVRQIRDLLVETLAHIEVGIDHSDDVTLGPALSTEESGKHLVWEIEKIRRLIQSYEFGRIARDGVKIAIVGKPNAGKSSLLNCLLKSNRAIVTAVPGTTRDTIEEGLDLFGLPAVLVDTAGIREGTSDPVEKIGIDRTLNSLNQADALIVLLDSSQSLSGEDRKVAELVRSKKKSVVALNKCDLQSHIADKELKKLFPEAAPVRISALKNTGIDLLLKELFALVSTENAGAVQDGQAIVSCVRHRDCLSRAEKSLERAIQVCGTEAMDECLALEIRDAIDALGELVGAVVTEDILKEIFSKFCIGK